MPQRFDHAFESSYFKEELEQHGHGLGQLPGWIFQGMVICIDNEKTFSSLEQAPSPAFCLKYRQASNTAKFAGAETTTDMTNKDITHVLVGQDRSGIKALRKQLSTYVDIRSYSLGYLLTGDSQGGNYYLVLLLSIGLNAAGKRRLY